MNPDIEAPPVTDAMRTLYPTAYWRKGLILPRWFLLESEEKTALLSIPTDELRTPEDFAVREILFLAGVEKLTSMFARYP